MGRPGRPGPAQGTAGRRLALGGDSWAGTACDTAQVGALLPHSTWLRAGGCRDPAEVRAEGQEDEETRPSPWDQPQPGPGAQAPEMGGWASGRSQGV